MAIPEYIIKAANEYKKAHGNKDSVYDAFIAGYKATRRTKSKNVELTENQKLWFERAWVAYGRKGSKGDSVKEWVDIPESDYQAIINHIEAYKSSRSAVYQKDFERYLRGKTYLGVVVKDDKVIYSPEKKKSKKSKLERFIGWVEMYYPTIRDMEMPNEEQLEEMIKVSDGNFQGCIDSLQDDYHTGSLYDLFIERFGGNR